MYLASKTNTLAITTLCAMLTGCGGLEPLPYAGLQSSAQLTPNTQDDTGRVPYHYAPRVDWRSYSRMIIDPVTVYRGRDQQFGTIAEQDRAMLGQYMQASFTEALAKRFTIVNDAGQNTLRLKLTLTGAATTPPVIGVFTHIDLGANLYNGIQAVRGREGLIAGSVLYAVEVYDAPTDRLLSAFVSKQYPNAMNIMASAGSLAAAKTGIDKGASALVDQLQ